MTELGLFPLGIVLLPSEQIPLHIFEDRYQELIGECLETDDEFGLVYADDDGIREVGTRARVSEVLTRFEDGRLNILILGGERFQLDELTDGRTFHTGLVSALEDELDPAGPEVVAEALRLFDQLRELTGSDVDSPEPGEEQLSYLLAGKVELPQEVKLELLGDVSERSRMDRVCELLQEAVITAQRVRRAGERAAGNGRVDLG